MANTSIRAAFERMWQHVMAVVGNKADLKHSHVAEDITDLQTIVDEALSESVLYTEQSLADDQKAQARENIGAISSWADIPDKPFGEISTGSDTLYWDGNREGLVRADDYEQYLISESTPTLDDFANGASNTYLQSGTETSTNLGMNTAIYEAGDGVIVVGNSIVALKDGATLGDITYPKKGTYFTWIGNDSYTTSLTITGYNGFPSEKQLDEKWLPNHTHSTGPTPITTEGDGSAYTATIDGVTELYTGLQFVMIPHTNSTTTSVTLNVNGLGAKMIRQRLSTNTSISVVGATDNWIVSGKPVTVTYNGSFWIAELTRPDAANLYGTTGVKSGGTGKQSVTAGSFLVGNGTDAMIENTPAEVLTHIGALSLAHIADSDTDHLIPENADLNDYITPGAYRCSTSTIAKTLSNMTSYTSAGFRLIVSGTSTGNGSVQFIIFNSTVGRLWFRIRTGVDTWGDWKRILTSDDTTGTDSTDYTDLIESKVEMKLLWINASYDSSFSGQTISIRGLSNYDLVIIIPLYHTSDTCRITPVITKVPTSTGACLIAMNGAGSNIVTATRRVSSITSNSIVFGNCTYANSTSIGGTANNTYCIPYKVYGLKGVQ